MQSDPRLAFCLADCPPGTSDESLLECASGYFCVGGNSNATACPKGEFQGERRATHCEDCHDGSYCGEGYSAPTPCPAGRYAPLPKLEDVDGCAPCELGHYCEAGSANFTAAIERVRLGLTNTTLMASCEAGRFGANNSLIDYKCSGKCEPGYYCPTGSTSGRERACPSGTFNPKAQLASPDQCEVCDVGYYCPEAATRPEPCARYSSAGANA